MEGGTVLGARDKHRNMAGKPFMRQLSVASTVWTIYFISGLGLGAPTVYMAQIKKESNSTFDTSPNIVAWLYSVFGYSAIPWVVAVGVVTEKFGRKKPILIGSVFFVTSFIIFYTSKSSIQLLIYEIMYSSALGYGTTICILIVTEYTSPKYRGIFLAIKSASGFWGVWVSNAIGTYCHWRNIAIIGVVCSLYPLSAVFWTESPVWLASKGRFDDCTASHRQLKGQDSESEKELANLIASQKNKAKPVTFRRAVVLKEFYKPILLSIFMILQYHFSGKFVCSIYALEVIKKITASEETAYMGMLILDGFTVFSMYVGCVLSKFFKRRHMYLTSSLMANIFLYIISLYLYLVKCNFITENKVVSVMLLAILNIFLSCGPVIFSTSISGEILPIRFKMAGIIVNGLTFNLTLSTVLKISPYLFKEFGTHGAFLFYALAVTILTYLLYKYMPETKDKTLQEIEMYFKDVKTDESTRLMNK
ncbi:facilitated trehalose transporter Tret1-like [Galleria mellonella]|uniref:Facilitated trehalose transporter Tret1-like n=1 Tax=Galleria mellonella TaxID=7137 RepID=A0ABM3MAW0_GALME|nr:facilitated trehalose transporter Tret1-like [Galleria mellonella]